MPERDDPHYADTPLAFLAALLTPAEAIAVSEENRRAAYSELEQRWRELDTLRLLAILETIRRIRDLQALQFLRGLVNQGQENQPEGVVTIAAECLEDLERRLRYEAEARTLLRASEGPSTAEERLLRPAGHAPSTEAALLRPAPGTEEERKG